MIKTFIFHYSAGAIQALDHYEIKKKLNEALNQAVLLPTNGK